MKDDKQNNIKKLKQIYDEFLLDMAVLRKERTAILTEFSSELDKIKASKIEKNLRTTL